MKLAIATVLCMLFFSSIPTAFAASYGSGAYESGSYGIGETTTQQTVSNETGGVGGGCTINYTFTSSGSVDGTAGSSVVVPVTVTNAGACSGRVTVTATVPAGWTATSGTTKLLGKGDSDALDIVVTIPAGAATSAVTFKGAVSGKTYTSITTVSMPAAPAPGPTPSPTMPQPTPAKEHEPEVGPTGIIEFLVVSLTLTVVFLLGFSYYRRRNRELLEEPILVHETYPPTLFRNSDHAA